MLIRQIDLTSLFTVLVFFFFFNDTPTTEIYTLSLHDALPIWLRAVRQEGKEDIHRRGGLLAGELLDGGSQVADRKSTRLNSSHSQISYAVFCLKKKNTQRRNTLSSNIMYEAF